MSQESAATPDDELLQLPLSALLGRKVRIAHPGDFLTQDLQPGRITIFVDAQQRIVQLRMEDGTAASI